MHVTELDGQILWEKFMWHLYKNTFSLHKKNPSDIFYQKRYPIPSRITLFLYEGCRIIITSASPVWRGTRCLWAQCCKKARKNAFFFFLECISTAFLYSRLFVFKLNQVRSAQGMKILWVCETKFTSVQA